VPAQRRYKLPVIGPVFAGFGRPGWSMTRPTRTWLALPDPSQPGGGCPGQRTRGLGGTDLQVRAALEQSPRWVLRRQLERGPQLGTAFRTGVEGGSSSLLQAAVRRSPDGRDSQRKTLLTTKLALMRQFELNRRPARSDGGAGLGAGNQADHEDANASSKIKLDLRRCRWSPPDRHAPLPGMAQAMAEPLGWQ